MSVTTREQHNQVRAQLAPLRQRRGELADALRDARNLDDKNAIAIAEIKLDEINGQIEMARELEATLLRRMSGVSNYGGQTIFDDPTAITALEGIAATSAPIGNMLIGRVMDAEQLAARLGPRSQGGGDLIVPDSARQQAPYGIVRALYQPTDLLSLIPTATMTGGSFTYLIEGGEIDDTVGGSAEGSIKPEDTSLELDEGEVRAVTIASWQKLRRQQVADVPDLQNIVNTRLMYGVRRRIERQVLAGTGENETLLGVLNRTGIGSVAYDAGTPAADLILRGLTTVRLSNATPSGIVLHPTTYESLLTEKTDNGARLDSSGAFSGGTADTVWGVPVVQSPVVGPDRALVADWRLAATLFIREGLSLRLSDSDQDDFIRNKVTALAETRIGFAVWQPGAIAEVQLAASE